ncbi:MAG: Ribonuclease P protein component 4 [Methanoregulaceae archaeon PtaB.Bin152]|nr:MAG: Ribonuclease P protein component 4 [Methanoregulaceae archaeon PtaB.Bin152]
MARKIPRSDTRRIARERIAILFQRARECIPLEPARSDRYVALARKISMKHRVRLDRGLRRQFCHHCGRLLVPGVNMRVRIRRGMVVITCLSCHQQTRFLARRER